MSLICNRCAQPASYPLLQQSDLGFQLRNLLRSCLGLLASLLCEDLGVSYRFFQCSGLHLQELIPISFVSISARTRCMRDFVRF